MTTVCSRNLASFFFMVPHRHENEKNIIDVWTPELFNITIAVSCYNDF